MKNHYKLILLSIVFLIGVSNGIFAATKTWNSAILGSWGTAANWSPAGVPVSGDDVVFDGTTLGIGSCTINVTVPAAGPGLKSITIQGGYTGTINQGNKNVTINNGGSFFTMSSGTWSQGNGDMVISGNSGGNFTLSGGNYNIGGSGLFTLTGGGSGGGNFTLSGGTFNAGSAALQTGTGSSTGVFSVSGSGIFNGGSGSVTIEGTTGQFNMSGGTFTQGNANTSTFSANDFLMTGGTFDGSGAIANINITSVGNLDLSGAASFTSGTGTVTLGGGTIYLAGTAVFDGTNSSGINLNGVGLDYSQSGGTFIAPGASSQMTIFGDLTFTGGTFTNNSGTVEFSAAGGAASSYTITGDGTGKPTFNNLIIDNTFGGGFDFSVNVASSITTAGNFVLQTDYSSAGNTITLNGGTLNVLANIYLLDASSPSTQPGTGGTATIVLNGGVNQTIFTDNTMAPGNGTSIPDQKFLLPNVTINEGANATIQSSNGAGVSYASIGGTFTIAGGNNVQLGTSPNSQFTCLGNVTITNTDNTTNTSAGTLAFEGATSASFTSTVPTGTGSVGNVLFAKTGGTLSLNGIITVVGNLTDNSTGGSIDAVTGTSMVSFQGAGPQSISGTSASATPFYDLDLSPQGGGAGGLTVTKAVNVFDDFSMDATAASITLNTGNDITIKATSAAQNGYIGEILNPGSVSFASSPNDQFTIERFIPATTTTWANMGSPGLTNITFQAWGGAGGAGATPTSTFVITCPTCTYTNVNGSAFNSVDIYSETAGGLVGDPARYVNAISNIATTSMANGTGYWVFRGNSGVGTGGPAITLSMNGSIQKEASPMPSIGLTVTNTGAGVATDHGWNLIANPYPCPISWASLWAGNASVDNETHIYSPSAGADASWDGTVGVNGGSDVIPMGQGFAVHATSATSLPLSESMKTGSQQSLFRVNTAPAPQVFRMAMDGGPSNWHDELALYFKAGVTTPGRSNMGGAMKFYSNDYYAPAISTVMSNGLNLSIYAAPPFSGSINIPVMAMIMKAGTYTIKTTNFGDVPPGACVVLYDNVTHTTHDLRSGGYTYTSDTTTVNPRFNLIISTPVGLTATTSSNEPTCSNNSNGNIIAKGSAPGPWDYVWTNGTGATVRTVYAKSSADTLSGLNTGTYTVNILRSGACDQTSQTFTITNPSAPVATYAFTDNDTLTGPSVSVQMNNSSVNASSYYWNFGNGTNSTNSNPLAVYTAIGNYTVTLDAFNVSCHDTVVFTNVVHILPPVVTGINNLAKNSSTTLIGQDPTGVFVQFNNGGISNSLISVYNELGQKVIDDIQINAYKDKVYLDLSNAHNEMLLIHVQSGEKSTTGKVFNK